MINQVECNIGEKRSIYYQIAENESLKYKLG